MRSRTRSDGLSRRRFLKGAAAAAATVTIIPRHVLGAGEGEPRRVSPNEKLNVACIGCGGKGGSDVGGVRGETIVALCDVDQKKAGGTFKKYPNVRKYKDWRKMLDELDKDIDAVTVSTPDHVHFPASMTAIMRGKHVFCQKPLTHNIWEARAITAAARKHKVATQMGIQGHSGEGPRLIVEWVRGGVIGPVREVHYWTNRPIWRQGCDRPTDRPAVPGHLDWDLWLGPAPTRPYHSWYAPFAWRGWWDFGCGALGDIGCHAMDAAFWALELGTPTSVEAVHSGVNEETAPKWSVVTYQFPAREKVDSDGLASQVEMPPVKVIWHDGNKRPPRPKDLEENRKLHGGIGGQLIIGDKATIMATVYGASPRIIPESKMKELQSSLPPKSVPRSRGHVRDWIEACKGGKPSGANFDFAGPMTEMVVIGNLAVRSGKRIEWDGPNMKVTNVPEANRYVRRVPRKGWTEPYEYGEKLIQPKKAPPKPRRPARTTAARPSASQAASQAEKKAEQLFKMARQAERMGQRGAAKIFYRKVAKDYPGTSAAARAAERLKALGD